MLPQRPISSGEDIESGVEDSLIDVSRARDYLERPGKRAAKALRDVLTEIKMPQTSCQPMGSLRQRYFVTGQIEGGAVAIRFSE